jgi:hypothetical protein
VRTLVTAAIAAQMSASSESDTIERAQMIFMWSKSAG